MAQRRAGARTRARPSSAGGRPTYKALRRPEEAGGAGAKKAGTLGSAAFTRDEAERANCFPLPVCKVEHAAEAELGPTGPGASTPTRRSLVEEEEGENLGRKRGESSLSQHSTQKVPKPQPPHHRT